MKYFLLTLAIGANLFAAGLGSVKSVYLMPMANGLDQYLAVQLTSEGVFQVVTDARKADAVFTDHLGQSFEDSLKELYGDKKPATNDNSQEVFARVGGTGSRGRGTTFLVDRNSRDVIWSTYEPSKRTNPEEVKHRADRIVHKLVQTVKGGDAPASSPK